MKELVSFISLLFKRPVSWVSLFAPPLLHIIGLGLPQILLTSAALFFSSFFFTLPIPKPNTLLDSKVQDQDLGQQDSLGYIDNEEESFIELSLPSGNYVGHHYNTMNGQQDCAINNKNQICLSNNLQDFRLIQLLAEFEDDNLIEIDISIGSIKCSTFQIQG
ncbi:unnamed protein product [Arabis nemorensis]|uniref:Uncharacterized protein n=1 Tax=Arabis nemorensis TaxID=586526 RepID=A0A565BIF3_9BRAS|nr:unnamed protein product [Arabis nemorensis]